MRPRAPFRLLTVIPAHNERGRVGLVARVAVEELGRLGTVLVVDDGSSDGTAAEARASGASVLELRPNRGKGGAMRAGMDMDLRADAVLFLDADLIGLCGDHLRQLVAPVAAGEADMVCGLRDYQSACNALQRALPPITGERCVRADILQGVHPDDWQGFRIEAGINEASRRLGGRVELVQLQGLGMVPKWHKGDITGGFEAAARMSREVLVAMADTAARVALPPRAPFAAELIVPAHNEQGRVGSVVRTLREARIGRVLVVDDGSTDGTAREARAAGADVISLSPNRGKGGAMRAAVQQTRAPWVGFFDADLVGLTPAHVRAMASEARSGEFGMVSGVWVQTPGRVEEAYVLRGIDLSGQRLVHRTVLNRLPERYWQGYGIEVALEEACARQGYARRRVLLEGLRNTSQLEKRGAAAGADRVLHILTEAMRSIGRVRSETW